MTNTEAYRQELQRIGYNTSGVHPSAYRTILRQLRGTNPDNPRDLAKFKAQFPDATRLGKVY